MTILSRPRLRHCAAAFVISSELREIVIFGGRDQHKHLLSDTTILRLSKFYTNKILIQFNKNKYYTWDILKCSNTIT